jgi:hypothetical protein
MEEEEKREEEITLEHGMFAVERIEDIAAMIIGFIIVVIALLFF